jgi:tetratricopeptide (TPR) repeat protein
VYLRTGDNQNAIAMCQKALPYYERGDAPLGQANVYKSLGDVYLSTGDNQNALVRFQKADQPVGPVDVTGVSVMSPWGEKARGKSWRCFGDRPLWIEWPLNPRVNG